MTVFRIDPARKRKVADRLYDVHEMLTQLLCVGEMAMNTPDVLPNPVGYLKEVRESFRVYDEAARTFGYLQPDIADSWECHRRSLDTIIEALEEMGERYNPGKVLCVFKGSD